MAKRKAKMDGMEVELASCILYYDGSELSKFFSVFDDILSDQYMMVDGTFSLFVKWVREWAGQKTEEEIDAMESESRRQSILDWVMMHNRYRPGKDDVEIFELWLEKVQETNVPMLLAEDVLYRFIWERYKEAVERVDRANIPFKDKLAVRPHAPQAVANHGIIHLSDIQTEEEAGTNKYSTGVKSFDLIVRMEAGNFVVVGARPGVGKSLMMLQMAMVNAENGVKSLYMSLEMSKKQLHERIVNYCVGHNLRSAFTDEDGILDVEGFKEATEKAKSSRKFKVIDENLDLYVNVESSADRAMADLEEQIKIGHYEFVCVDYLQLLRFSHLDEWASIREATKVIKRIAFRNDMVIVAGSQVSRASTERGLYLTDLFGGQSIEADTDIVIGMEEVRERKQGPKAALNFKVMKNRNGDKGENRYMVDYTVGRIEECQV